jgi:Na+-translocating ferredoxin:NAD+ oxidoreductase subunit B
MAALQIRAIPRYRCGLRLAMESIPLLSFVSFFLTRDTSTLRFVNVTPIPTPPSSAPEQRALTALASALHAVLPQTQCTRCGYPDCAEYAQAMARGDADINQCPPGGSEGIERLAALTHRPVIPLHPDHGVEGPRQMAVIDEDWCIGCTLCIKACPVDAIVGGPKVMHTVIEAHCTGCELCVPVCPVDCISLENTSGTHTGWAAWSAEQARTSLARYEFHRQRVQRDQAEHEARLVAKTKAQLGDGLFQPSHHGTAQIDAKRAAIEAAMARARAYRVGDESA